MKRFTTLCLAVLLFNATNATKGEDNKAIVRGILDTVRYYCETPPSSSGMGSRKLISVDRIYAIPFQAGNYEVMTKAKRLIKKNKQVTEAETLYSKWIFGYRPVDGRPNIVMLSREDYDSPEEYNQIIDNKDKTAQIAYPKSVTSTSDASNNKVNAETMLRFLTIESPAQVAAQDNDVVAAKQLLSQRPPDGRFGKESEVTKKRKDTYLKVSYHIGRISFRRDAQAKVGKVDEKKQRLAEKQREWTAQRDTHSMMAPKPILETMLIMEPPAEALARKLSEAYDRELDKIQAGVKILTAQLITDTEDNALWMDAKEQENKGRMSLGGENGIPLYEVFFGRFVVPFLEEMKDEPANSPAEALNGLISALIKVETQLTQETIKKIKKNEN
jgi:hypothetical protein